MTTPELSVVVATRNRAALLRECLESLDRQTAARDRFEVVVVVDGATDDTAAMLGTMAPGYALVVVAQPQLGSTRARNAGAARAKGELLLFVDDDEVAAPELVEAHLDAHAANDGVVVIGAIERRVPSNADRFARVQVEDARLQIDALSKRPPTYWDCYGGNCSMPRAAFDRAGGYAPDMTRETDTELGYRLHATGLRFVFAPAAIVSEYRDRHWRAIVRDAGQRGRIAVELYRRHPAMIAQMPLGGRGELARPRSRQAIERLLLAFRIPPNALALAGLLARSEASVRAWSSLTLRHAYWSGARAATDDDLWRRLRSGVVILGYHAFALDGERASRYVVPRRRFARQLWWLRRAGYTVMTFGEYLALRADFRLPPAKTVVVTVDDGYVDAATVAGPVLRRFGLRATVFLVSAPGNPRGARLVAPLAERPMLGVESAHLLPAETFEIGSHTRTHPDLTTLSVVEAGREIGESKAELERGLRVPVTGFAYPFGACNPTVRRLVEEAEYAAARGTRPGRNRPATDPFDLRWLEVRGTDSFIRFAAMLVAGETRR
jgi:peptidoglycan/xylan/chitin deacetylase (PgdA/CDA1 family)/glycosyltransferase involved in cell wall biosynthesis